MERRKGVVMRKVAPESLRSNPEQVRRLCESFVDKLVELHSLNYKAAGLGELGRPEGFIERQVHGWTNRYQKSKTEELPAMNQTAVWLTENRPSESGAALIHNDYKYDNLILEPTNLSQIIGVLDWEMATLGDPLMDLGVTLSYWVEATDSDAARKGSFGPTTLPGSYTRRDLVDRYRKQTGRNIENIHFYFCYGLFKLAVIVQQIYARFARGLTKDPRFNNLNEMVRSLSEQAVEVIDKKTI
jgi:aminoglycoside phosphotransferase (APT) family kinase protein